ncbi:unnamed protein product [Allacma fusca]|uniref:Uncharacterized protein n=1 Tax=Allacma fusca TaxID=39272 RepID=A0A8J2KUW2_9HEXA|nr:unnamed protein product [Allacma fusca]
MTRNFNCSLKAVNLMLRLNSLVFRRVLHYWEGLKEALLFRFLEKSGRLHGWIPSEKTNNYCSSVDKESSHPSQK